MFIFISGSLSSKHPDQYFVNKRQKQTETALRLFAVSLSYLYFPEEGHPPFKRQTASRDQSLR